MSHCCFSKHVGTKDVLLKEGCVLWNYHFKDFIVNKVLKNWQRCKIACIYSLSSYLLGSIMSVCPVNPNSQRLTQYWPRVLCKDRRFQYMPRLYSRKICREWFGLSYTTKLHDRKMLFIVKKKIINGNYLVLDRGWGYISRKHKNYFQGNLMEDEKNMSHNPR